MSRREPGLPPRRRRVWAGVLVAAVIASGVSGGAAWALWSDAFTNPSLQVATGSKVGIALGRVGGSSTAATGPASILSTVLDKTDADAMLASPTQSLAIPLAIKLRADGNAGIRYSFARPVFSAGSLFAVSTVRLFPITATTDAGATAACTAAAAPATQPSTTGIVGIAAGKDPLVPTGITTAYWCLTAVYPGAGGTYTNTATASGTAPSGVVVQGQSSWQAYVVNPGLYALTHAITLPGSP